MSSTIIQNLVCVEIPINNTENRVYFNSDKLNGKKIKKIWFYFSDDDFFISSPFEPIDVFAEHLIPYMELNRFGIFVNIFDRKGNGIIKNLSFENITHISKDQAAKGRYGKHINLNIDCEIDTTQSFLVVNINDVWSGKMLMYFEYETKPISLESLAFSGSHTIEIPIGHLGLTKDILLSDYVDNSIKNKRIKQITIQSYPTSSYLHLKGDNVFVENLPTSVLLNYTPKSFYFDNIRIDWEQSYLKYRGSGIEKEIITFYY